MYKHSGLKRLTAALIALIMLLGLFAVAYSEDFDVTEEATEEAFEVTEPDPEPETVVESESESDPEPEPEEELIPEPEEEFIPEPEEELISEPEDEPEPEPEPEDENTVVTELETETETTLEVQEEPEDDWDDLDDLDGDEDFSGDDELVEFDDEDAGAVSEELLQQFNNPDLFEHVEFSGSADIELENTESMWEAGWDGNITLTAVVRDANLSYRLVWEANDHDDRGWFTVGSGDEYSYTLTRANAEREANREYRVVMFTVD